MSDEILYERCGHVRLITINRPARMNSMDFAANDALIERWREFDADDDARCAVVTGAGDTGRLLDEFLDYAARLASRVPLPQRMAKEVMHRVHGMSLDEALRLESDSFRDLGDTRDLDEGTRVFREGRGAVFEGR